jgi:FkbM family methyltransferase
MSRSANALMCRPVTPAVSTVIPLPRDASAEHMARAIKFQQAGKFEEALKSYDEVLRRHPGKLAAIANKAAALRSLGRSAEAMPLFMRALSLSPDNVEIWNNMGNTLLDLGRTAEAEEAIKTALSKAPDIPQVWVALTRLLLTHKHISAAELALKRAVAYRPNDLSTRLELATLWHEQGQSQAQIERALEEFQSLEKINPHHPRVLCGLGQALTGLGRLKEAEVYLKKTIALEPQHLDAHLGLARLYLLNGDFEQGWREYEWRRQRTDRKKPHVAGIEWDGSDPTGKTILVYAEQGFGDTIQFLRFITPLSKRGAKVVVVCQKSLVSLVQQVEGVTKATCLWRPLPKYDFYTPLLSLPHKLKLGAESGLPGKVPYIATTRKAEFPPAPLGTRLKVGIVWAGSATNPDDHNRSTGLEALLPLTGIAGAQFYSLQVGSRANDITKVAHPALIIDFSKHLKEYADTAAVIQQLDLVISVDTSVAHLAGALGKPAWVMVPCIPDWRWQIESEDSLWYPTMRLFRNGSDGDWHKTIATMVEELKLLIAKTTEPPAPPQYVMAHSIFGQPDGKPRFTIDAPRKMLEDPGIGFMVRRERMGTGYEYATRCLLDEHLEADDLFLDIGAHWGIMSMHVATHHSLKQRKRSKAKQSAQVIAFEPLADNITHLHRCIADNGLGKSIKVIPAAVSNKAGQGNLLPESTMGHRLEAAEDGSVDVITIDEELKRHKDLAYKRVIIKIDVEGHEPEVIAGMANMLASGKVAIVIWERGVEYNKPERQTALAVMRELLAKYGFTAWRFDSEDRGGSLVPYKENGHAGNIIEFAPNVELKANYGIDRPKSVKQPDDPYFDTTEKARFFLMTGNQASKERKLQKALEHYASAAQLDSSNSDLYNNLGVILREVGKQAAKQACYYRAQALKPSDAGIASNLGNALREEGSFAEAEALHNFALAQKPQDAGLLYNAALVHRDNGHPEKALAMLDQSLAIRPNYPDCEWDRALLLLQNGDYAEGFPAYESRWKIARAYKRSVPLQRWQGEQLNGRSIFLHDEQGYGDVMQFARFIPELKEKYGAGKVVLECQPQLMRLMTLAPGMDAVIPRQMALPHCDFYVPLLSLPGIFGTTLKTLPNEVPYLNAPDMAPDTAKAMPTDDRLKLGLVWAGQVMPRDRSCPLGQLLPRLGDTRFALMSLQVGDRAADLKSTGADAFITDMSPYLTDFAETAAVLSQLDLLITIDTSVAHLAGALGVPTYLLLRHTSDWRWLDNITTSPWYPNFTLFRQTEARRWNEPLEQLEQSLKRFVDQKSGHR